MVASGPQSSPPSYDQLLNAYQHAFRAELRRAVESLPLTQHMRVLDVPCGNGFYSRCLADRLGPRGKLDAVDLCPAYLSRTRRRLRGAACAWNLHDADVYRLPFADKTFDLVWCAQSLISLDDVWAALAEMKRVLRPHGMLAVLENDILHHVLLPWPIDLEVPVQRAIQLASRARFGSSAKLAPVRWLPQLLSEAGFHLCRKQTLAADRQAPWSASVSRFLSYHVRDLRKLIGKRLSPKIRRTYRRFVDPHRPESLFGGKAMDLTCLNVLYEAKKTGE